MEVYKPFRRLLGPDAFHATYLWHWEKWWVQLADQQWAEENVRNMLESEEEGIGGE